MSYFTDLTLDRVFACKDYIAFIIPEFVALWQTITEFNHRLRYYIIIFTGL